MIGSTPTLTEFDPTIIPFQKQVIDDIASYDYSKGTHEVLLSGSVGSAKSILMAHIIIRHCLENNRARFLIGRRALPDLKDTLYLKILEHLEGIDQRYYRVWHNIGKIWFVNGSEIISKSWADKRYSKLRSLELSGAAIEELTENHGDDEQAYHEIKMRVGRLPHIKCPLIIAATNPDSPGHWAYRYFIAPNSNREKHPTRHVFYSRTEDNPFLPTQYINQLKADLDPKRARRMLYGEWIEIADEVIYYQYNSEAQADKTIWRPRPETPILISFDFNIGDGKPLSALAMAYEDGCFHAFDEVIIDGARTDEAMKEFFDRGIIVPGKQYEIYGDASGKARHTSSKRSDYEIIKESLDRAGISYKYCVPLSNPAIRTRHNTINAYCKNERGEVRLFVHNCPTLDQGLRLTAFKKGANLIEDDSKRYQHVTTALGYCMVRKIADMTRGGMRSTVL
ncbi:MAG: phage terminase large subunit [Candidatus Nanopelagicaceae bacterium]